MQLCMTAGFSGNQLVGGLLLHTTRNTHTKSCGRKFSKFVTSCTYNHTLYDDATGEVVVLPTTTGGLLPYGVDTFFLETASAYDASLTVCKSPCCSDSQPICLSTTPGGLLPYGVDAFFLDSSSTYDSHLSACECM